MRTLPIPQSIFEQSGITGLKNYVKSTNSINTKADRLGKIRSMFKKMNRPDLLDQFQWSDEFLNLEQYKRERSAYLVEKLNSKTVIYFSIHEYQIIYQKFRRYPSKVYSLILAGMNSGRRISELVYCDFQIVDNNHIKLLNPLKKKKNVSPVIFPLLFCSSTEFIEDIQDFKKSGIGKAWVCHKLKEIFNPIDPSFSFHTLRSLYGFYSYELYCKNKNYDRLVWLSDVLGHEKSNFTSSLHYNMYFENKENQNLLDKVKIKPIKEIGKIIKTYSPMEKDRNKILSKRDLENLSKLKKLRTNSRNNRRPQYILLCEALMKELEITPNLIIPQKGLIFYLRKIYKLHYNKDLNGKTLKEFYQDLWGYK